MDAGLAVNTNADGAAPVIISYGRLRNGGWAERADTSRVGGGRALELLNIKGDLLCIHSLEDVGSGRGQQREHREGAVFLVLLEATSQAGGTWCQNHRETDCRPTGRPTSPSRCDRCSYARAHR